MRSHPTTLFLISLALSDLIFGGYNLPLTAHRYTLLFLISLALSDLIFGGYNLPLTAHRYTLLFLISLALSDLINFWRIKSSLHSSQAYLTFPDLLSSNDVDRLPYLFFLKLSCFLGAHSTFQTVIIYNQGFDFSGEMSICHKLKFDNPYIIAT